MFLRGSNRALLPNGECQAREELGAVNLATQQGASHVALIPTDDPQAGVLVHQESRPIKTLVRDATTMRSIQLGPRLV